MRRPASSSHHSTDQGSASVWVLAVALVTLVSGLVAVAFADSAASRHRMQGAADFAALAAAASIGLMTDVCAEARQVSAANGVVVDECSPRVETSGRSGLVRVQVSRQVLLPIVGRVRSTARAQAERMPP